MNVPRYSRIMSVAQVLIPTQDVRHCSARSWSFLRQETFVSDLNEARVLFIQFSRVNQEVRVLRESFSIDLSNRKPETMLVLWASGPVRFMLLVCVGPSHILPPSSFAISLLISRHFDYLVMSSSTSKDNFHENANKAHGPVILAAVEGGGTSFRVAICEVSPDAVIPTILHRTQIDSSHSDPHWTLDECTRFLYQHKPPKGYHALGLATFGPLGVRPSDQETYGCILDSSPKADWRGVNLLKPLVQACEGSQPLYVKVDTDVNAPALAEYKHAVANQEKLSSVAYVTVGTGK